MSWSGKIQGSARVLPSKHYSRRINFKALGQRHAKSAKRVRVGKSNSRVVPASLSWIYSSSRQPIPRPDTHTHTFHPLLTTRTSFHRSRHKQVFLGTTSRLASLLTHFHTISTRAGRGFSLADKGEDVRLQARYVLSRKHNGVVVCDGAVYELATATAVASLSLVTRLGNIG